MQTAIIMLISALAVLALANTVRAQYIFAGPTNPMRIGAYYNSITIAWDPAIDTYPNAGTIIYEVAGTGFTPFNTTTINAVILTPVGPAPALSSVWNVTAIDSQNRRSSASSSISGTCDTLAIPPPTEPSNISGVNVGLATRCTWTASTDPSGGFGGQITYNVYMCTSSNICAHECPGTSATGCQVVAGVAAVCKVSAT